MSIKIQLYAAFADLAGARDLQIEYRPGMRCADVWEQVRSRHPEVGRLPVLFAMDREYVQPDTELEDGQVLMLFPPLGGG